jgi:hypothetical protein
MIKGLNKNERQIIWRKLHPIDKELLHCAINCNRTFIVNRKTIAYATQYGYLELLQFMRPYKIRSSELHEAAFQGYLDTLKWIENEKNLCKYEIFFPSICNGAIKGGQTNILDYIKTRGYDIGIHSTSCVLGGIKPQIRIWFIENGYENALKGAEIWLKYCR